MRLLVIKFALIVLFLFVTSCNDCKSNTDCDVAGEICDNGDCVPGAVCGNNVVETGEQCDPPGNTCDADCQLLPFCGDQLVQAANGEQCDDGNLISDDSCDNNCQRTCGNGVVDAANNEQCDDGNFANGDGCDQVCQIETSISCGDGVVQAANGEECDDGNLNNGDGCSQACQFEVLPNCGDGNVDAGEQCDDGNLTNGDGCNQACQLETPVGCGDGNVAGVEQCDDGNLTNGDGCSSACQIEAPTCGDGLLDAGEQCDDGNNTNGDGCDATCQFETPPNCGDGVVQAATGEQCDDGNLTNGDGCDQVCQIEASASCGDGVVQTANGEECDDGNNSNGDGCRANCTIEACGDGILDIGEQCDDGNPTNGDGCSQVCQNEGNCADVNAACVQSSDCCVISPTTSEALGCADTNNDNIPDQCQPVGPLNVFCGVGASAHICECADGIDNDGDGGVDTTTPNNDIQCLGPTDDNELEFATGIPGDNNGANGATECPFDGNSGPGNDGDCDLFVPNGCDCSLCCGIDGNGNNTSENFFAGGGNCRDAPPNNNFGTEGGPCTFTDANGDGVADNTGGCGVVDIAGTNVQLSCLLDGNGVTTYCSTCVGCQLRTDCVNECNCCETCVGPQNDPTCDPETGSQCVGGSVCETNIACDPAVGTDCLQGEACNPSSGDPNVDVCFQQTCVVGSDCLSGFSCSFGCCVFSF